MVTSQTAIVPLRSCSSCALDLQIVDRIGVPLDHSGALAADACLIATPLDLMKKYAPTANTGDSHRDADPQPFRTFFP